MANVIDYTLACIMTGAAMGLRLAAYWDGFSNVAIACKLVRLAACSLIVLTVSVCCVYITRLFNVYIFNVYMTQHAIEPSKQATYTSDGSGGNYYIVYDAI